MSYTELDAWIDEKALGEWPFDRWDIGSLPMRDGYNYTGYPWGGASGLMSIHHGLLSIFGHGSTNERLRAALDEVVEVVKAAIEQSDTDAHQSWVNHEVWLPVLDDSLNGDECPADMFVQSLGYVGTGGEFSEQELCAALGLWLIAEYRHLPTKADWRHPELLAQIGVCASEAQFHRGFDEGQKTEATKVAKRSQTANDARHAANRARVKEAEQWWSANARGKMTQAEAARQIASKFHVVEEVAKRYVRAFNRADQR